MCEGIGGKQITEFIIPAGRWNSEDGDQRHAKGNHQQPDHNNGENFAPCQPSKTAFHMLKAGQPSPGAAGAA
jgi:hypothetical protein